MKKLFAAVVVATAALSAQAAAPQWNTVAVTDSSSVYVNASSVGEAGDLRSVWTLRNHRDSISLGNDPVTGTPWYPHRSAKVEYTVNCAAGQVAMTAWKLYSGNFGDGDTVWADRVYGELAFSKPALAEEQAALNAACSSQTALR
jgi:hypothetical protein